MFIFYDFIFLIIAIIHLPIYLLRRKFHAGLLARLGFLPKCPALKNPIWIHAVSVGEVMATRGILEELRGVFPERDFVITTVTQTGNKIARGLAGERDFVTYLPFDLSFIVNKFINRLSPSLFIALETEIWPNLILSLYNRGIPVAIINGRISDKSFKGYLAIKFLLQSLLNKINLFCVQAGRDAERLLRLGAEKDKIQITGNMKFDVKDYTDSKRDYTDYRQKLGLRPEDKLFVAGSTHRPEEEIILDVYKSLLKEFSGLKLLIAPRHPERAGQIERIIANSGFDSAPVSQLAGPPVRQLNRQTVFILDSVGQLLNFYAVADIVFVGGSLVKAGGHNILEPAMLGKPIIFGRHMFNFRDIADLFLSNKAALLAHNQQELKDGIRYLLNNPSGAAGLAHAAKEAVLNNQGATKKNLEHILKLMAARKVV